MTIGLCVITPHLSNELKRKLTEYAYYVDKVYVQVNDKDAVIPKSDFEVSKFEWCDDFAAARNALTAQVKTDYWCWMDADDTLDHPERLREIARYMKATDTDIVFADYDYDRNEQGFSTEYQRRERIFKTGLSGEWRGAIHETFIPNGQPTTENTKLVKWIHDTKTPEQELAGKKRNEAILRKVWMQNQDPRDAYYLGLNQASQGKFENAIKLFKTLIERGGWDEERYRAYIQIATCYQLMGKFPEAANEYLNATTELPGWPDAYYGLQQVYYEVDDHEKSIHWFEIGQTKTRPDTDSAYNPVVVELQPLLQAGLSYLFIGRIKDAVRVVGRLKKIAPGYAELPKLEPEVIRAYREEEAINAAKTLIKYTSDGNGEPLKVLEALPATVRADVRLTEERRTLLPGQKRSGIVFYCGQGYEPWGPEYLDGGMGGSEEAVVYLAQELGKHQLVTVYNERREALHADGVTYLPWTEINPNDEFDTFVAWRDPAYLQHVNARVKLCDLHDALSPNTVYENQEWVDKYIFKSQYHRDLYPKLPDSKCAIISNGIARSQFV